MADIFISYSSRDREKAEQLTELLASAGLSVWIDRSDIAAASSWTAEIVDAINDCKVFVALLSPSSIESHNVIKEISLASEKRKKILPLDLEPVSLPRELEYQLAGIQRASMTNIDAILRALGKLGLEVTQAPTITLVRETDSRKSLMILPFEDLSPTADNEWFADGLASELIGALSNIKALKLIDWNTSRAFKKNRVRTTTLAKEFAVRYFIEGQVRKFGDQIKISVTLLDIETGDHLWQDSLRGTMNDIFDMQEQVAAKAVEGLKLHLTSEDSKKLSEHGTANAEAYELYLKAPEYYYRQTRSDYKHTLVLLEEAVRLDPAFVHAYAGIANTCCELYRRYERTSDLLERAASAAEKVREIEGESAQYFWVMSRIAHLRSDVNGALRFAKRSVESDPKFVGGHDALGHIYLALGNREEAVKAREEDVRLRENVRNSHFGLLIALHELGDMERLRTAAERALPLFERHARLSPDDYNARVELAHILHMASRAPDALHMAEELSKVESLDGQALYDLACIFLVSDGSERGMELLRRAVKRGYKDIDNFQRDPDLDPLRGTPEFESLIQELEAGNV